MPADTGGPEQRYNLLQPIPKPLLRMVSKTTNMSSMLARGKQGQEAEKDLKKGRKERRTGGW